MKELLRQTTGGVLYAQVGWALLAALWNVAGVYLVSLGLRSPGPTASLAAACILLLIAAGLVAAVTRWPAGYALLTVTTGLMALAAVVNAFTADPALWPSEFWRYAGAALNGAGFIAALLGGLAYARWK